MIIFIKRTDNSVSVMRLAGDAAEAATIAPEHIAVIVEAELACWPDEDRATVVSWRVADQADIPQDRTFRNAWRDDGEGALSHCMDTCRAMFRDRIREARAPRLAALDVDFQRALEAGSDTKAIVTRKQGLRDLTKLPAIDAAATPEQLKAAWPADLG